MINEFEECSDKNLLDGSNSVSLISPFYSKFPKYEPKIKIAILASGNGSNFEYIIKSIIDKKLNAHISILIVNNPDCHAINRAIEFDIPYIVINHKDTKSRLEHDNLVKNKLKEYSVELVVMAGWMRIVGEDLIKTFDNRLINIHPSLLPSFKGIDAIQQAIDNQVCITGCTVHYVKKEVDSGEIIMQGAVPLSCNDSYNKLKRRIQDVEHKILPLSIAIVAKRIRSNFKDKK